MSHKFDTMQVYLLDVVSHSTQSMVSEKFGRNTTLTSLNVTDVHELYVGRYGSSKRSGKRKSKKKYGPCEICKGSHTMLYCPVFQDKFPHVSKLSNCRIKNQSNSSYNDNSKTGSWY